MIHVLLLALAGCLTEAQVEREIAEAAYCDAPEDCVDVGSYCPFGCNIVVNAAEADRIERLMQRFDAQTPGAECLYDCMAGGTIACEARSCVVNYP